jgi:hypothetical protein
MKGKHRDENPETDRQGRELQGKAKMRMGPSKNEKRAAKGVTDSLGLNLGNQHDLEEAMSELNESSPVRRKKLDMGERGKYF